MFTKSRMLKLIPFILFMIILYLHGKFQENKVSDELSRNGVDKCVTISNIKYHHPFSRLEFKLFIDDQFGFVETGVDVEIDENIRIGDSIIVKFLPSNYLYLNYVKKGCD